MRQYAVNIKIHCSCDRCDGFLGDRRMIGTDAPEIAVFAEHL